MTFRSVRESIAQTSRSLRRAPGFVAIATLSLGAALGLSTSVFALIDAMTHPNAPFDHVEQLYAVIEYGKVQTPPSPREVREALSTLSSIEGIASTTWTRADVEAGEAIVNTSLAYASPGFFNVLRVRPRIGRLPSSSEVQLQRAAVVSDNFWKLRYGNRASTDGAVLSIDGHPYSIVGVLPPRAEVLRDVDVWIPQVEPAGGGFNEPIVRLRPGVTQADLETALKPLMRRFDAIYGGRLGDRAFEARSYTLRPDPLKLTEVHHAMIGAALCVLLIACANVAALMLARGTVRRRDYALRLALGASRRDIAREVILEVSALAVTGSIAGAVVATWAVGLMTRATPAEMTWMGFVAPQWSVRVLGASALAVIAAVAVAGALPAWNASRTDPAGTLKESAGGTTSRAGTRFRWLVVAELALAMTLMVGASLMLKSALLMAQYSFGFDANRLFRAQVWASTRTEKKTGEQLAELYRQALERLRVVPGVESAASIGSCPSLPPWAAVTTDRTIEGSKASTLPACSNVSGDYFRTIGRVMAQGRDFTGADALSGGAVILGERTARRLFPHESPIERTLKLGVLDSKYPWMPIVGVVRDDDNRFSMVPELGADTTTDVIFLSVRDSAVSNRIGQTYAVRAAQGATGVRLGLGRAMHDLLPRGSTMRIDSWAANYQTSVREERFLTLVFSLLGATSLALGAAGVFSVVSYIAGQRMREYAVRIALGATRENVVRLVLREALVMVLGGTAVGAGLGMWGGFMLWDRMYGVYPVDATALVAAEATLLIVTMAACLGPALRAMKANPVDVMRAV